MIKITHSGSLILFWGMICMQSCTSNLKFMPSSIVPAASGSIRVKQDKNKNYVCRVSLRNLAEPDHLSPARKVYVVWMESAGKTTRKLGQIAPYSKQLRAAMTATTTAKPDQVFLTAEDDGQIEQAVGPVIISTSSHQP